MHILIKHLGIKYVYTMRSFGYEIWPYRASSLVCNMTIPCEYFGMKYDHTVQVSWYEICKWQSVTDSPRYSPINHPGFVGECERLIRQSCWINFLITETSSAYAGDRDIWDAGDRVITGGISSVCLCVRYRGYIILICRYVDLWICRSVDVIYVCVLGWQLRDLCV